MRKAWYTGIIFLMASLQILSAQGLKGFKLANGLTVYIWEDDSKPDIFGMVGVKAGAVNDPEDLTGLAHYLEHLMFKGTETIGTADWEKEKPLYDQIIAKYDEMAATTDPARKEALGLEINKLTIEAARYIVPNDFAKMTDNMGGKQLNAGTSWDYTTYFSSFPPSQLYKWLELNSERFIRPVFRTFQPELETVYEEFNRAQDGQNRQQQDFMLKHIFPGHPYSRSILGLQEHLKNPRLSQLIKFYNDWYVPENMVLILVGNVKLKEAMGLIKDRFGRLENRPSPQRVSYPEAPIKGRTEYSAKMADYPTLQMAYASTPTGHPDELLLQVCTGLLSNRNQTGLLDKLTLDGDAMNAYADMIHFKDQGRIVIGGVPYYDVNQKRFESLKSFEKLLKKEIVKLQKGEIEEWRFNSVKNSMMRDFDLAFESSETKANLIQQAFICNEEIGNVLGYKERLAEINLDQIKEAARKYFGDDYIVIQYQEGKPQKAEKLPKPDYEPINPPRNQVSAYSEKFRSLPVRELAPRYNDFGEVRIKPVNDRSKLFYTSNPENSVFTLTLKYGVGTREMPKLEYAVRLMNNAGIMGAYEPQELKQAFSELGTVCNFYVNDDYLTVTMSGYEENLEASCNLLTRQLLMPKLDEKQLNNLIGSVYHARAIEEKNPNYLNSALLNYVLYKEQSDYLTRLPLEEIMEMTISNLAGEFIRATDYEAEIHYVGALPFESIYDTLSKNLPLKANEKETRSPSVKDRAAYQENTIYFIPDNDALQSKIHFFVEGNPYKTEEDIDYKAFNKYFGSGFGGLVLQEIREYRSMAYTADAAVITPPVKDKNTYFQGFIGTQADKTVDAVQVFLDLVNNMPPYEDRMTNIKDYLRESIQTAQPGFRYKSQVYEAWKRLGFTEDPAIAQHAQLEKITFEDVLNFYTQHIKNRPIAIGIIGDPKRIDLKALEKYGKVVKLSKSKLFSSK